MDRATFEARLIQAEKRVALGAQHIARQREFVLGLERLGNYANAARELLNQFETIQAMQIENRDRLLLEFNKLLAGTRGSSLTDTTGV